MYGGLGSELSQGFSSEEERVGFVMETTWQQCDRYQPVSSAKTCFLSWLEVGVEQHQGEQGRGGWLLWLWIRENLMREQYLLDCLYDDEYCCRSSRTNLN